MMRAMISVFVLSILYAATVPAWAIQPCTYDRFVQWADANIKSDIPEPNRVYVMGPDQGRGISGGPSGTPLLLIPVTVRHAVRITPGMTLADVLRQVPTDAEKVLGMNVYRAGPQPDYKPVFTARRGDSAIAHFAVQPRDIIHLFYIDPNVPPLDAG
jgi:hypothetical protein